MSPCFGSKISRITIVLLCCTERNDRKVLNFLFQTGKERLLLSDIHVTLLQVYINHTFHQ
uniref:Uncharacterized protein n=1 Tax=Arundo donax TaxID=35708 RepID=A0A0A9HPK3_ARUDO